MSCPVDVVLFHGHPGQSDVGGDRPAGRRYAASLREIDGVLGEPPGVAEMSAVGLDESQMLEAFHSPHVEIRQILSDRASEGHRRGVDGALATQCPAFGRQQQHHQLRMSGQLVGGDVGQRLLSR
jgi:hypothetical protein